jgi:hypothetical protein
MPFTVYLDQLRLENPTIYSLYRRVIQIQKCENNMERYYCVSLGVIMATAIAAVVTIAAIQYYNIAYGFVIPGIGIIDRQGAPIATAITKGGQLSLEDPDAPIATSGDNVYIAWPSNKTGNWEIMFIASTDGGKTFGEKINVSNSTGTDSVNQEIAAAGNNLYISWWEVQKNGTREPVFIASDDNGKTFGEKIMLSTK